MKKRERLERQLTIQGLNAEILKSLSWLHYANAKQLTRLHLKVGSLTYMRDKLHTLALPEQNFLKVFPLFVGLQQNVLIYTLGGRGMNYLKETGQVEKNRYFRPSEVARSPFFLPHTLAVNDFMIALQLVINNDANLHLIERKHEIDIKREQRKLSVKVTFPWLVGQDVIDQEMYIYPDAVFALEYRTEGTEDAKKYFLWLEIDRNTETNISDYRKRIRAIIQYVKSGDFEKLYGFKRPTIGYLVTEGGQARVNFLHAHAMKEIASTNEVKSYAQMFRFAPAPESWDFLDENAKDKKDKGTPLDVARNLIFGRIWSVPFVDNEKLPLLKGIFD